MCQKFTMENCRVVTNPTFDSIAETYEWIGDSVLESIVSQCLLSTFDSVKCSGNNLPPSWFRTLLSNVVTNKRLAEVFYRLPILFRNQNECLELKKQADFVEALVGEVALNHSKVETLDYIVSKVFDAQYKHMKLEATSDAKRFTNTFSTLDDTSSDEGQELVVEQPSTSTDTKTIARLNIKTYKTESLQYWYGNDHRIAALSQSLSRYNNETCFSHAQESAGASVLASAISVGLYCCSQNLSPAALTLLRCKSLCKSHLNFVISVLCRGNDMTIRDLRCFALSCTSVTLLHQLYSFLTYLVLDTNCNCQRTRMSIAHDSKCIEAFSRFYENVWTPKVFSKYAYLINKSLCTRLVETMESCKMLLIFVLELPKPRKTRISSVKTKAVAIIKSTKVLNRFKNTEFLQNLENAVVKFACHEILASALVLQSPALRSVFAPNNKNTVTRNWMLVAMKDGFYRLVLYTIAKYHGLITRKKSGIVEITRPRAYDWKAVSGTYYTH